MSWDGQDGLPLPCAAVCATIAPGPSSAARDHEPNDPPEVDPVPRSKATVALRDPRQALLRAFLMAALLLGLRPPLPSPRPTPWTA